MTREELVAAYTAPGRHYHNLAHIEDCLAALARVDNLSATQREILSEAIWWHDVVYDATRTDNEELSAFIISFKPGIPSLSSPLITRQRGGATPR